MIEQLKTIREALALGIKAINHLGGAREAMPLHDALRGPLTQLEAMVGEQEPVHWRAVLDPEQAPQQLKTTMHVVGFREKKAAEGFVAEQIDFYGWRYTIEPLYAAPVAQQPQAESVPPSNLIDPGTVVSFAVDRWLAEVANRPLVNKNRRTLDDTWRQVIRRFGGNPDSLIGPDHDTLLAVQGANHGD